MRIIPAREIEEIKVEAKNIDEISIAKSKEVKEERLHFLRLCKAVPDFKEKLSQEINEVNATSDFSRHLSELAWAVLLREIESKLL